MISIQLKNHKFWLLVIAIGCITIHLTLVWVADNQSLLSVSFLFWAAVCSLSWGAMRFCWFMFPSSTSNRSNAKT
ncbi:hypothetical protein [Dulcicalothrix desertica]|uniref:hypothetical protein n=1 Tax=Dulcicalothrix desertica TaxID=32056 RepID=UPI000F8D02C7|nr:hypothetical protein [Dulcicalothrix desertica]